MQCPKCGSPINQGMTFCPKCGQQLGANYQTRTPPQMNLNVPSWFWVFATIAMIALVGSLVYINIDMANDNPIQIEAP